MATRVFLIFTAPQARRDAFDLAIAPHLVSPNAPGVYTLSAPLVPTNASANAPPTHYGCCLNVLDDSPLFLARDVIRAAAPGSAYSVVSPWTDFDHARDWILGQSGAGLRPWTSPAMNLTRLETRDTSNTWDDAPAGTNQ